MKLSARSAKSQQGVFGKVFALMTLTVGLIGQVSTTRQHIYLHKEKTRYGELKEKTLARY